MVLVDVNLLNSSVRVCESSCLHQTAICPVGVAQQHAIGRCTSRKARGEVGHLFIWGGKGHVVLAALPNIWVHKGKMDGGWGDSRGQ